MTLQSQNRGKKTTDSVCISKAIIVSGRWRNAEKHLLWAVTETVKCLAVVKYNSIITITHEKNCNALILLHIKNETLQRHLACSLPELREGGGAIELV